MQRPPELKSFDASVASVEQFDAREKAACPVDEVRFNEALARQIETAGADDVVAVTLFDVLGLRHINRRCGRRAGDEVLELVARSIRSSCRDEDGVVFLDKGRLALLMTGVMRGGATRIAERVSREVEQQTRWLARSGMSTDVTFGVADSDTAPIDVLLARPRQRWTLPNVDRPFRIFTSRAPSNRFGRSRRRTQRQAAFTDS